jgi:cell fate regulator YaaT (PSP1 superfamily)
MAEEEKEHKEQQNLISKQENVIRNRANCGSLKRPCQSGCFKLEVYDWLKEVNTVEGFDDVVEVRFKNTRKGYFQNTNGLRLNKGDVVAVEASPGHDIGIISLTGQLVRYKMQAEGFGRREKDQELKKVYRKAKSLDIDKWKEAIGREHTTMIKSRQISADLKLNMKIGDVEYQGDGTKAIFYYIADDRVDFRQLIKVLAEQFKIRVEMRQIGARQEAGRIGGIGSCGRELCCASWITNFVSVTTNAARYQEVSLNPQKLAGQCGKLKCCMNYELDVYLDAQKDFPNTSVQLKTRKGRAYHQKTDVFKRLMWYMYEEEDKKSLTCMSVDTVKDVIAQNAKNKFPEKLVGVEESASAMAGVVDYQNSAGIESLTRFEDNPTEQRINKKSDKRRQQRKGGGKPYNKNRRKDNRNFKKKRDNKQ